MISLSHYSKHPALVPRNVEQDKDHFKPVGLWVSVDDAWFNWCENEGFRLDGLQYRHIIELTSDANVLILSSVRGIDTFHRRYHRPYLCEIDWSLVAEHYDGIVISPYQYGRRLDTDVSWYYGWDCASGCLWNVCYVVKSTEELCYGQET